MVVDYCKQRMKGIRKKAAKADSTRTLGRRVSAWNIVFLALGIALATLLHSFVFPLFTQANGGDPSPRPVANPPAHGVGEPWGDLEIIPMVLDRPDEFFAADLPPSPKLRWFFEGHTPQQLEQLFRSAVSSQSLLRSLLDAERWHNEPRGIWVEPPLTTVRELEPAARAQLYKVLARSAENNAQRYPFYYRADGFDEWFYASGLPRKTVELVRSMTYRQLDLLCFSDRQYFELTRPQTEARALSETLARVPTVLMTLRVASETEADSLVDYWATPPNKRNLKPLLRSLARVPGGGTLNVSYLLPPIPRSVIYTYPHPTNSLAFRPPDCFWSTMNFFNQTPDDGFLREEYFLKIIKAQYRQIAKPERLGDVILLCEPNADLRAIHACVFIAEDVVFTKNGRSLFHPWVLMRMPDLLAAYPSDPPYIVGFFRHISR